MTPALPGHQFNGEEYFGRRLQDLERFVQQLGAANQLASAGIQAVPDGIVVNGSETVNGLLTINGPAVITGTLSLPAGVIGNDALANPVTPGSAGLSVPGLGYTTTSTVYASQSIPVPTGFTQALVFLGVSGGAVNSTASADYIYVSGDINGVGGGETPQLAAAGGYGSASAFAIRTLTGLSGGSITVGTRVRTGSAAWAANASNLANTNAIIQFLR